MNPDPVAIPRDNRVDSDVVTDLRILPPSDVGLTGINFESGRTRDSRSAPPPLSTSAKAPAFISDQVTAAHRFYHFVGDNPGSQLAVVCGGWEDCAADYAIDRSSFPYLSLEFVAAGEGEVRLAGNRHPLCSGTVFSYGPGISQEIRTSAQHRLRKYFVDFVGSGGGRLLRECKLEPGRVFYLLTSSDVREAFDTLIRFADSKRDDAAHLCTLQLEILIRMTTQAADSSSSSERRARSTFERCRQQIDQHFIQFRTSEEAARWCHVDVSYLCRLFHRFQSESPFRYLQRQQMAWAAHRLRSSDLLIREVADELGIEAFQFSRTFKRLRGVSPSQFLNARPG